MSKSRLIKRLSWYYPTERFNAYLFTGVGLYVLFMFPIKYSILLHYGLLLMVYILFQGQRYWKLKLLSLKNEPFDQKMELAGFRKAKRVNQLLIYLVPFVFGLQLMLWDWNNENANLIIWGAIAVLFGICEHINYYHRQLMIDNVYDLKYLIKHRRLKIASLRKDLIENKI